MKTTSSDYTMLLSFIVKANSSNYTMQSL